MLTDIKKVRHIYDKIESAVRNLKSLKVDIWLYGPVFIFIIMNKLPTEIKLQISRIMPATEMWNVTNLLEVLLQEINSRELCSYMSHTNLKQNSSRSDKYGNYNGQSNYTTSAICSGYSRDSSSSSPTSPTCTLREKFPNMELFLVRVFSHSDWIRTRNNSVSGHFSRSVTFCKQNHSSLKCNIITDPASGKAILRSKAKGFICLRSGHKASKRNHSCNSSQTSSALFSVISNAPSCASLWWSLSASLDILDCTIQWIINCSVKCIFFFTFFCIFICSLKWNLRCALKCDIECHLNFTFLLNHFVHSCALKSAPPCASSSATQLLPQVHPFYQFQPQMHLLIHVYTDPKVHL